MIKQYLIAIASVSFIYLHGASSSSGASSLSAQNNKETKLAAIKKTVGILSPSAHLSPQSMLTFFLSQQVAAPTDLDTDALTYIYNCNQQQGVELCDHDPTHLKRYILLCKEHNAFKTFAALRQTLNGAQLEAAESFPIKQFETTARCQTRAEWLYFIKNVNLLNTHNLMLNISQKSYQNFCTVVRKDMLDGTAKYTLSFPAKIQRVFLLKLIKKSLNPSEQKFGKKIKKQMKQLKVDIKKKWSELITNTQLTLATVNMQRYKKNAIEVKEEETLIEHATTSLSQQLEAYKQSNPDYFNQYTQSEQFLSYASSLYIAGDTAYQYLFEKLQPMLHQTALIKLAECWKHALVSEITLILRGIHFRKDCMRRLVQHNAYNLPHQREMVQEILTSQVFRDFFAYTKKSHDQVYMHACMYMLTHKEMQDYSKDELLFLLKVAVSDNDPSEALILFKRLIKTEGPEFAFSYILDAQNSDLFNMIDIKLGMQLSYKISQSNLAKRLPQNHPLRQKLWRLYASSESDEDTYESYSDEDNGKDDVPHIIFSSELYGWDTYYKDENEPCSSNYQGFPLKRSPSFDNGTTHDEGTNNLSKDQP